MKDFSTGLKAFELKDYVQAFKTLIPTAKAGYPEAQCIIANIYHLGLGQEIDLAEAIQWYAASANQGYGVASNNLSELYRFGYGTEQDIEAADYWRDQTIAQGFPHVQKLLGLNKQKFDF